MSRFSGKQERGAMRAHKEDKKKDAEARQRSFSADVERIMAEQNINRTAAVPVAAASRRVARRTAQTKEA